MKYGKKGIIYEAVNDAQKAAFVASGWKTDMDTMMMNDDLDSDIYDIPSTKPTVEQLEGMTNKELQEYAEENNIDLAGATRKEEIINAIAGASDEKA